MIDGEEAVETPEAEGAEDATLLTGDDASKTGDTQDAEGTDEGDKPEGDEEGKEEETEEAEGAPEAYEEFTVAEGVQLNTEVLDEFKATAKELNLSQANAQKLVDTAVKLQENFVKTQADAIIEVRGQWKTSSETDAEIGGDKLPESLATAKRALGAYGSEALGKLLDETGLGNHPEIIRLLVKAGATVSEDQIVTGKTRTNTPTEIAERLYGGKKE